MFGLLFKFVFTAMFGFYSHHAKHFTNKIEYVGWRTIANWGIGTTFLAPFVAWFYFGKELKPLEETKRFYVSWFITALFYGIGVVMAWVNNPLEPTEKL